MKEREGWVMYREVGILVRFGQSFGSWILDRLDVDRFWVWDW